MSEAEELTVLTLEKKANFVETPYIQGVAGRALDYIGAGYPIHFWSGLSDSLQRAGRDWQDRIGHACGSPAGPPGDPDSR